MAKRERKNELKVYLSDDENYILEQKVKAAKRRDKSSFIRHLIVYGFVFDIDYSYLREYNTNLARINNNLNQIAKRMSEYSCAVKPHVRSGGNRQSGTRKPLCASLFA